jgi:2'-5' RNA ligase
MDHIVIPIGKDHASAIEVLASGAASAAGVRRHPGEPAPHVTVLAYTNLSATSAQQSVGKIIAATRPFRFHAHGYGFFAGAEPSELCLHVPVVRNVCLDALHELLCATLTEAGADIAGWSVPDVWSPHITLLDRSLDPARLGAAAAWLARRRHPSWDILADRVVLTGGWADHGRRDHLLQMGTGPAA